MVCFGFVPCENVASSLFLSIVLTPLSDNPQAYIRFFFLSCEASSKNALDSPISLRTFIHDLTGSKTYTRKVFFKFYSKRRKSFEVLGKSFFLGLPKRWRRIYEVSNFDIYLFHQ